MGNKSEDLNQLVLSTLSKTTKLPFVKVSREEFLRKEFKGSEYLDIILKMDRNPFLRRKLYEKEPRKLLMTLRRKQPSPLL